MMASLISSLAGDREFEIWHKPWTPSGSLSNKLLLPTAIDKERLPFHLNFGFWPFLGVIITFYPLTSSHSTVQESDTGLFHNKFLTIVIFYIWILVHLVKKTAQITMLLYFNCLLFHLITGTLSCPFSFLWRWMNSQRCLKQIRGL